MLPSSDLFTVYSLPLAKKKRFITLTAGQELRPDDTPRQHRRRLHRGHPEVGGVGERRRPEVGS